MKKERIHTLDTLRGVLLINMIAYHTLWDLVNLFHFPVPFFLGIGALVWERFIACGFVLLSGFCSRLGAHRVRRALTVLVCGAVITAVSFAAVPSSPIYFGVLTFLGVTSLIAVPAEKFLSRVPPATGLAVSSVLFVATYRLNRGKLLFFSLPRSLYANLFTAFFGFPYKGFSSSDYFPLFPWIFLFYAGYFLYGILTAKGRTLYAGKKSMLSFIGKHTLPVYMLHQPIIYAVLSLLDRYSLL